MKKIYLINPPQLFFRPSADMLFGSRMLPLGLAILQRGVKSSFRGLTCMIVDMNNEIARTKRYACLDEQENTDLAKWETELMRSRNLSYQSFPKNIKKSLEKLVRHYLSDNSLIGFTILSEDTLRISYILAQVIKNVFTESLVVFGGPFVVLMMLTPERYVSLFDVVTYFCSQADGVRTLSALLDSLHGVQPLNQVPGLVYCRNGMICVNPPSPYDIENEPIPDFTSLDLRRYREADGVIWLPYRMSIGCTQNCAFCTHRKVHLPRFKPINKVVADIECMIENYQSTSFVFYDAAINNNRKLCEQFCEHFKAGHLSWKCYGITWKLDKHFLLKMKNAGCRQIEWGIESGCKELIRAMGKPFTREEAFDVISWAHNVGIQNMVNFVLGFPYETIEQINETACLASELEKNFGCSFSAGPLKLIEHSPMYDNPEEFGIKLIHADEKNICFRDTIHYEEKGKDWTAVQRRRWNHTWLFNKILISRRALPLLDKLRLLLRTYLYVRRTYDPNWSSTMRDRFLKFLEGVLRKKGM